MGRSEDFVVIAGQRNV